MSQTVFPPSQPTTGFGATPLDEVARGERFGFGKNWTRFLATLTEERIRKAELSLLEMLEVDLQGRSFLDIGSGSGLFSLAARRLGARVHSINYDPESVACTADLRRRYFPLDPEWTVEQGSVLDADGLRRLGVFDVVYCWGVAHHTGDMWTAMKNVCLPVSPGGFLFISIYNDAGSSSRRWRAIKRIYNHLPGWLRVPYVLGVCAPGEAKAVLQSLFAGKLWEYVLSWTAPLNRGMSRWHDLVDWVGGYPYEFATPDEVFDFFYKLGFTLTRLKCGYVGLGCNEFVFRRQAGG